MLNLGGKQGNCLDYYLTKYAVSSYCNNLNSSQFDNMYLVSFLAGPALFTVYVIVRVSG